MSYGEVYANRSGSLLMDLGVTVRTTGASSRAMLLIRIEPGDWVYSTNGQMDLLTVRNIDLRVFDPTHELYFGPPR